MTLELVPWRGHNVPVFGRDEIARYTTQDYINWITQNQLYTGQPPIQTTYGSRPAEPISYSFQGFVEGMLYADGPVAAAEAYRLRVFGQAPLLYQETFDGRPGDVFDDKNLDRLRAPWPGATLSDLMKRSLIYGDFAGNAFIVDIDDELVLVRPDWVEIVLEQRKHRGQVLGYKQVGIMYYEGGLRTSEGVPFLPGEYAHFVPGLPDPLASYRGMSWLTPILREVQADKSASAHKLAFFENAASPNLAVQLPKEVTPEQFNAFVEAMDAKHKGAANAYKTLYTGGGADVTVIGANMQQMDFSSVQGKGETRLANAAGVPPVLLSFSEGMQGSSLNAGNYTAAKRNFVDTTMRDLWSNFAGSIAQMDYFQPPMPKTRLWYDGRDIPFLHEDAKDLAGIQSTQASTINGYIREGWEPESAKAAVMHDDLGRLKHTGALSVQLQPPGAQDTNGDGQADDFAAPPELQNFDFGSLREGVGNTGADQPADGEAQRARWDLRYGKGNKGGGKFRSLKDAVVPILKDWASGKGDRDPLEQFQPRQLRTMAKQMADDARKAGEHQRARSLTLGPRVSKAELKKALYDDAMWENTGTRPDFANPASKMRISDAKAATETRPRQTSMREMGFDDALDNGDFDRAMDLSIEDFRERRGRDMTPDELDRLERNIDAAIGRREKKKPTAPGQPAPEQGLGSISPDAPRPFTGRDERSPHEDRYDAALEAGDREGMLQARTDAFRERYGEPAADDQKRLAKMVDDDLARQAAAPSVRSAAARPLTELFDADDATIKEELAKAIDGDYAGGLSAKVSQGHSIDDNTFEVSGQILGPDGSPVGEFLRTFTRRPDGTMVARHEQMKVDPEFQGAGFAADFNNNLIDWYRRSGFDEVETHANEDIGPYAWPAQGFDFAPSERDLLFDHATFFGEQMGRLSDDEFAQRFPGWDRSDFQQQEAQLEEIAQRIADGTASAYEVSQLGRKPGQGKNDWWIGKALLLGTEFDAVLPLKEGTS